MRDEVSIPKDWGDFAPPPERRAGITVGGVIQPTPGVSYEERAALLGDGPGLGGFHEVILHSVWAYLSRGRTKIDWLKEDLRRRIREAPAGEGRDGDLERYLSDEYLDDSIAGAQRKLAEEPKTYKLTRDRLQSFAKKLSRKADDREAEIGHALLKVCGGELFGEPRECAFLLPRMLRVVAQRFDTVDPESLGPVFGPSVQLMQDVSVESVVFAFRTEQQAVKQQKNKKHEDASSRIAEAFKNGRDYPYTQDEIASFGPHIARRWVIQRGNSFYPFFNGSYRGPYTKDDILNAVVRELAPASSAGVQLFKVTKAGEIVQKTAGELVREYGTVADDVVLDLCAQVSRYDEATRTLIEAPCPLRKIEPVYHADIDAFLQVLAQDKYEKLKTWLAASMLLQWIAPALFITGPPGIGKTLLGIVVSRLYTEMGPTELEHAFSDFNEQLAHNPVCFADEKLPEDFRGRTKNAELRIHIQQVSRYHKRKFHDNAKMLGATRTIVCANNHEVLATKDNLTPNDVKAIVGRYLHIEGSDVAREFLEMLKKDDPDIIYKWIYEDRFTAHILWLRDNHVWKREGRFLIEISDEELHRSILTRDGIKSAVCQWLVSYLLDPGLFDTNGTGNKLVRKKNGQLLVNAQALVRCWDTYVKNEKCPTTGHLSSALSALCEEEDKDDQRLKYKDDRGRRVAYRRVNIKNLIVWARDKGFADEETILNALNIDTEDATLPNVKFN